MDELACRRGQIAATPDELVPEAAGRGAQRQGTKRVADVSHQRWQMGFKPSPITPDQLRGALDLGPGDRTVETRGDGRGVDRPIRLRKLRQTTDADATVPTEKAPDPNEQEHRGRGADVPLVIGQRFQGVRPLTIGAVFWAGQTHLNCQ